MEYMNRSASRLRTTIIVVMLLLAVFLMTACGPRVIKGRPPLVGISDMSMSGETLDARFDISNQNGEPMTIDTVEIGVSVNASELLRYESNASLLIDANSTEGVSVRQTPSDFTRKLLTSLDKGALDSLSIDLKGRVHSAEDGNLRFEYEGYLYPMPGRPGQYRAAVTQAKGLVREDPR